MEIQESVTTNEDLDRINRIALEPLTAEQVYTFRALLIDDKPTANGRVYTDEWRAANAEKFIAAPVILRHDIHGQAEAIGRVYESSNQNAGIYGSVYIPTNTESGRSAVTKVKNGQLKAMSIHALSPKSERREELDYIYPSDEDRILEVSFVAVGGCESCGVVKENHDPHTAEGASDCDPLREFALETLKELQSELIRTARFTFGAGTSKATWTTIAESVDPLTLKQLVQELKRKWKDEQEEEQEDIPDEDAEKAIRLRDKLQSIRKIKGV